MNLGALRLAGSLSSPCSAFVPCEDNTSSSSYQGFTLTPVGEHARKGQARYGSEECCGEHDAWRGRASAYIKAGKEEGSVGDRYSPKRKTEIHSGDLCRDSTMNFPASLRAFWWSA